MYRTVLTFAMAASLPAVEFAPLFSDNAVFQQSKPLPIWGTGIPGEEVQIHFANQDRTVTVHADGTWATSLDALPASKLPCDLRATGKGVAVAKNILVGEVWICSGQSNMEWPVQNTLNAKEEIASSDLPSIRLIKVPNASVSQPLDRFTAGWRVASPKTVGGFTAAGFYFAREITKRTEVPIGLISCSWGGTRIEPWISPVGYQQVPELKGISDLVQSWDSTSALGSIAHLSFLAKLNDWIPSAESAAREHRPVPKMPEIPAPPVDRDGPTKLWNGMIYPLVPYAIRGVLWYQGEANYGEGDTYLHKLRALISGWRLAFGQGDFPFFLVQLANYQTSDPKDASGGWAGWARLREAQRQAAATIPHVGMAVAIDLGEAQEIHFKNKQDVGKRLALLALSEIHGMNITYSGPLYRDHVIENDAIRIRFDHVGSGLLVADKKGLAFPVADQGKRMTRWWSIAGADKKWSVAEATIDGDTVVVSSPSVPRPLAVRYAYTMNPDGLKLYNADGLPASPFRTDTW